MVTRTAVVLPANHQNTTKCAVCSSVPARWYTWKCHCCRVSVFLVKILPCRRPDAGPYPYLTSFIRLWRDITEVCCLHPISVSLHHTVQQGPISSSKLFNLRKLKDEQSSHCHLSHSSGALMDGFTLKIHHFDCLTDDWRLTPSLRHQHELLITLIWRLPKDESSLLNTARDVTSCLFVTLWVSGRELLNIPWCSEQPDVRCAPDSCPQAHERRGFHTVPPAHRHTHSRTNKWPVHWHVRIMVKTLFSIVSYHHTFRHSILWLLADVKPMMFFSYCCTL